MLLSTGSFAWETIVDALFFLSGPFKVNGTPLRRVNQRYLIATSTSIDISSVKLPEKIDDAYFRRAKKASGKKGER